jgi:ligand-binding sensor domain-containing protein/two-component sensor histidine kinase
VKLLWAFILSCLCYVAGAQQRIGNFMAWGRDNGLPPSLYYSVFQSSDGYLWIGSSSGLVRFDGKRFKTFISDFQNPDSPSDNVIYDFAEDNKNNLWICGFIQGVTKYDPRTGTFKKYPRLSQDKNPEYGVLRVLKDGSGDLWFATAGRGLAKYLPAKDTFEFFYPNPDKPRDGSVRNWNHITGIAEDKKDRNILWLTCFDGLHSFDKRTKKFSKHPYISKAAPDGNFLFMCVEVDENNILWLGTWFYGLMSYDPAKKSFKSYDYSIAKEKLAYAVSDVKKVNDSLLYLASFNQGLLSFNRYTHKIEALLTTAQLPQGSSGIDIQRISVTPSAGVFAGGNYYIYQQHKAYNRLGNFAAFDATYRTSDKAPIELNEVVYDKSHKGYWMACTDSKAIHFFDSSLQSQTLYPVTDDVYGFRNVCVDKLNRVWAVKLGGGLYLFQQNKKIFESSADSSLKEVVQMQGDAAGNLWLLKRDGLVHWNVTLNRQTYFSFAEAAKKTGLQFRYGTLKVDRMNNAWVSSNMGLFFCHLTQKKVEHLTPQNAGLANLSVREMTIDQYGYPWLGFHYNGLQILDPKTKKVVSSHNLNGGLPGMQVNALATDKGGRIWGGFAAGLGMFDPKVKVWHLFNRTDGIRKDYLDGAINTTEDGRVFITQRNGFVHFSSDVYKASQAAPQLHITAVQVNGQPLAAEKFHQNKAIELPYNTREINIEYAAMDWIYPLRTKYFYRVENIHSDNGWTQNDNASINLAGLSPGNYVVHIYAVNGDGIKSPELKLPITIQPPFWMRWWFIALCALVFVAIVYLLYRYRIQQLKRLQEMRNVISRNLHDDIGASLSNISILNELAKRNAGDQQKATGYLVKAGEDIQRISESLSDIVWNINPRYDDLDQLFIRMKRYAADVLDGRSIEADLNFPEEQQLKVSMPMNQRRDFYLIFKEGINNLVKYAAATKAAVRVNIDHHFIELMIRDNGKGFDQKKIFSGNGLQNMKQRAAQWHADLNVETTPGYGTTIRLRMKMAN